MTVINRTSETGKRESKINRKNGEADRYIAELERDGKVKRYIDG